jgi:hypothetical protein
LRMAVEIDPRDGGVPSTKGTLTGVDARGVDAIGGNLLAA